MTNPPLAWLDCSAGIAGDMLLGALLDAGADLAAVRAAVQRVDPVLEVIVEPTARHGITASKATVVDTSTGMPADAGEAGADSPDDPGHHHHEHHHDHHHNHDHHHDHHGRPWSEVRRLVENADLDPAVARRALGAFGRLADAEANVHGTTPDEVHFHEVGALDAIGDVVGCAAALHDLGIGELHCSVLTLGSGDQTVGQHGRIPIPGPAVTHLARAARMVTTGGPVTMEMTTPTGAALLAEYATGYGPMPTMVIDRVGVGAGTRDPQRLANVLRIVLGSPVAAAADTGPTATEAAVVLECNVDDLDPRLWPGILQSLLDAGASDAWLSPITMKKGRPAQQLSVLTPPERRDELLTVLFATTSTIGAREVPVHKHVLDRADSVVTVEDQQVRVKVASRDGRVVNVQPEFDDVATLAAHLGIPAKVAMSRAVSAAVELWDQ